MSSRAEVSRSPGSGALVLPLYTLTLFLSAFLLFSVQPMFTKMVLPRLGGSAAVWNTAVVFFQATLLLGYAYAHFSTRFLGARAQVILHGGVLLVGFVALPIGVADWTPPTGGTPVPWLIGLLAVSIGLPFLAVSATAPLLQKWFAHTDHAAAGDPYFLYGGSNLGSLAALIAYPLLIERVLGLRAQGTAWTVGYALLCAVIVTCGVILVRRYRAVADQPGPEGTSAEQGLVRDVTWKLRLHWLALSVVPSALLLGVTLHIGTEIAAVPFLWVVPLSLYLLTFVLVFARRPWFTQKWMLRAQVLFVALVAAFFIPPTPHFLFVHVAAMFFTAMVCHGELARLRPRAAHLTEFYLWMSIGGVVGGFLTAIVAPLVFDSVYEYPIALVLGLLLRPRASPSRRPALQLALDLALPLALAFALHQDWLSRAVRVFFGSSADFAAIVAQVLILRGLVVALLVLFGARPLRVAAGFLVVLLLFFPSVIGKEEGVVERERSFFGVYTVREERDSAGLFHALMNGGVQHGAQNLDRPLGPVSYYVREGPVGQFFHILKGRAEPARHIGVIGLGVGMMACYVQPGQRLTYYEIDALDERIARDPRLFTYLQSARDQVEVKIGDGRQLLELEPDGSLDVLVLSAFSGDAIPVHLLTREAFQLYQRKLSERGMILMIVSNAHLDLVPVVANVVAEVGLSARISRKEQQIITTPGGQSGDWVVVARRAEDLARFAHTTPPWQPLERAPEADLWTDDFSNVMQVMRWDLQVNLGSH